MLRQEFALVPVAGPKTDVFQGLHEVELIAVAACGTIPEPSAGIVELKKLPR
jgi:hypothetical protein